MKEKYILKLDKRKYYSLLSKEVVVKAYKAAVRGYKWKKEAAEK